MNKSDLIRKYMSENPQAKDKRDIARTMMKLYPDIFTDLERARTLVRQVTGTTGGKLRNAYKNPDKIKFFFSGFEKWSEENLNNENYPWYKPFVIPDSIKKLNVIADLHSVHLDAKVFTKFLKSVKDKTAILINGDLIDSETLSRHLINHNAIAYDHEIDICHNILKGLKEEFTHVYFKEGNHDFWLERYLLINSRAMLDTFKKRGVNVKELLQCGGLGVHHIHNLQYIQYGDLDIIHAHEMGGFGGGKFPARNYLDKWQTFRKKYDVKLMHAHCHRNDHALSARSKEGKIGECWSMPAMCKKMAHFNPYAGWDNGWVELTNNDGIVDVKVTVI
jgi:hypothetical protein